MRYGFWGNQKLEWANAKVELLTYWCRAQWAQKERYGMKKDNFIFQIFVIMKNIEEKKMKFLFRLEKLLQLRYFKKDGFIISDTKYRKEMKWTEVGGNV